MIYVVLGMHKSGTTLVSQILHHSGINMGDIDPRIGYDKGNQYEREETRALNEEILGSQNRLSIDIAAPQGLAMNAGQRARMQALIQEYNRRYADWGFKDPRTTLVYPLWAETLPEHKLIVVFRSLDELWQRYRPRLQRRYRDFKVAAKLAQRWYEHNLNILNILSVTPMPSLTLEFSALMQHPEPFERFQEFVGRPLVDQRRMDLYRHRRSGRSLPLELAKWRMERSTGLSYAALLARLEAAALNPPQADLVNPAGVAAGLAAPESAPKEMEPHV